MLVLLLGNAALCCGQFNAIAGYDLSTTTVAPLNQLLMAFNESQPGRTRSFRNINVLHGFVVGGRWATNSAATELTYRRRAVRRKGDFLTVPGRNGFTDANFIYDIRTVALSAEAGGTVRLGGGINYNSSNALMNYLSAGFQDVRWRQYSMGSHLFAGVYVRNSRQLSFSARLTYEWIWSDLSLSELAGSLSVADPGCLYCRFRPSSFGLTILINNGRQPSR